MITFHENYFPVRKTKSGAAIFFFPTTKYNLLALPNNSNCYCTVRPVFTKVLDKKRRKRVESDDLHWGRAKLASERAAV